LLAFFSVACIFRPSPTPHKRTWHAQDDGRRQQGLAHQDGRRDGAAGARVGRVGASARERGERGEE
jgi:hypothetical protein